MTNLERVKTLDLNDFWQKIQLLTSPELNNFVDVQAWLRSENADMRAFKRESGTNICVNCSVI
jgi:hypothetical protein